MPRQPHIAIKHSYPGPIKQISSKVEVISLTDPTKRIIITGIWDTGAEMTMITPKVFTALGLIPIDTTTILGVGGGKNADAPIVLVTLNLENTITATPIRVAVGDITGVDMLIGLDLIQLGDFSISGLDRKPLFTFVHPPFENRTDLSEKAEQVNKRGKGKR